MNPLKLIYIAFISILFVACNDNSTDKVAQLEKLKAEQIKLDVEIKKLEAEIANEGIVVENKFKYVEVDTIQLQTFKHFIEVQGKVDAVENANVSARTPGVIISVNVREGQRVSKNQLLAEIDNGVLRSSVEEAKTALALATTLYERQKNLWDQGIGSEVQFLSAKNNMESLKQRVATLNAQLELTRIRAPFNGTIDKIDARVGENTGPGVPAFRVVNFSRLKAKANIAESQISKVKVGDATVIQFPDIPKEINSKLTFVSRSIDAMTRTFTVESTLTSEAIYRPNMIAIFKINDYTKANAVILPVNLIQTLNNEKFVMVAEKSGDKMIAKKRVIVTGMTYNDNVEIESGLTKNDIIIKAGNQGLNEGEEIRF